LIWTGDPGNGAAVWAMVGSFIGLILCVMMNPALYHFGILKGWARAGAMRTIQSNTLDFYFSFAWSVGRDCGDRAVAHLFARADPARRCEPIQLARFVQTAAGRGDFSI